MCSRKNGNYEKNYEKIYEKNYEKESPNADAENYFMNIEEKIKEVQGKMQIYPDSDELKLQLKRLMTERKDILRMDSEFGGLGTEVRGLETEEFIPDVLTKIEKKVPEKKQITEAESLWKKVFNGSGVIKEAELSDRLLALKIAEDHTSALNIIFRAVYNGELVGITDEDGFFTHIYKLDGDNERV